MESGHTVGNAIDQLIAEEERDVRKLLYEKPDLWSTMQAWNLTDRLLKSDHLDYAKTVLQWPFEGSEDVLKSFEEHGVISIAKDSKSGRTQISFAKPLTKAAIQRINLGEYIHQPSSTSG